MSGTASESPSGSAVSVWPADGLRPTRIPLDFVSTIHANPEAKTRAGDYAISGAMAGAAIGLVAGVVCGVLVNEDPKPGRFGEPTGGRECDAVYVGASVGIGSATTLGLIGAVVGLGKDAWEMIYWGGTQWRGGKPIRPAGTQ